MNSLKIFIMMIVLLDIVKSQPPGHKSQQSIPPPHRCPELTCPQPICHATTCPQQTCCQPTCTEPICPAGTFNDGQCDDMKQCQNRGSFCIGKSCCKLCPQGVPIGLCNDGCDSGDCVNGLCCSKCSIGVAIGTCSAPDAGSCGDGYECDENALCCPVCFAANDGVCNNGQCDNVVFACNPNNNLCCQSCKSKQLPADACLCNQQHDLPGCSCEAGFNCESANEDGGICCPACDSLVAPTETCPNGLDSECTVGTKQCQRDKKICCPTCGGNLPTSDKHCGEFVSCTTEGEKCTSDKICCPADCASGAPQNGICLNGDSDCSTGLKCDENKNCCPTCGDDFLPTSDKYCYDDYDCTGGESCISTNICCTAG